MPSALTAPPTSSSLIEDKDRLRPSARRAPARAGRCVSRRPLAGEKAARPDPGRSSTSRRAPSSRPIGPWATSSMPRPRSSACMTAGHVIGLPVVVAKGAALGLPALDARDALRPRRLQDRDAGARTRPRCVPERADRAAARLRSRRLSPGLWRRLLRPHAGQAARAGARACDRLCLCRAGGRCRAPRRSTTSRWMRSRPSESFRRIG